MFQNPIPSIAKRKYVSTANGWQPKYYLALIYWGRDDEQKAWDLLKACGSAPDYAPFYAARASLAWKVNAGGDPLADWMKAAQLDPKQWRYGKFLAEYYSEDRIGQFDKAMQTAKAYYDQSPENYQLGALYAKTLLLGKQYSLRRFVSISWADRMNRARL